MNKRVTVACILSLAGCSGAGLGAPSSPAALPAGISDSAHSAKIPTSGTIIVGISGSTGGGDFTRALSFDASATGNVKPIAQLPPNTGVSAGQATRAGSFLGGADKTFGLISASGNIVEALSAAPNAVNYAVDGKGNFYEVIATYDADGRCYTGDVTLQKYKSGSGGTKLVRTIDLGDQCYVSAPAIDGHGNVFVGEQLNSGDKKPVAKVVMYAPGQNGPAPSRTIPVPIKYEGQGGIAQISADQSGNLYMLCDYSLYVYPHATLPRKKITDVFGLGSFAVDGKGLVYTVSQNPATLGGSKFQLSVSVFAPGSSTVLRTISGGKTGLNGAGTVFGRIVVLP
jgi:hypothetical protein